MSEAGSTLNGRGAMSVTNKASGTSNALTHEDVGGIFTNAGAGGAIEYDLPAALVGMRFRFAVMAAQALQIDPNGTETIGLPSSGAQGAAGKYLVADAVGEWVELVCVKKGEWFAMGYAGTWTAEG